MTDCILCDIDDNNNTLVKRYNLWTLLINYKQPTLGSSLIVLNRHIERLSELSDEEALAYVQASRELETRLKESFEPDRINHLMLANTEPHVHYHVVPRYAGKRSFAGREWVDPNYCRFPKLKTAEKDQDLLDKVRKELGAVCKNLEI